MGFEPAISDCPSRQGPRPTGVVAVRLSSSVRILVSPVLCVAVVTVVVWMCRRRLIPLRRCLLASSRYSSPIVRFLYFSFCCLLSLSLFCVPHMRTLMCLSLSGWPDIIGKYNKNQASLCSPAFIGVSL